MINGHKNEQIASCGQSKKEVGLRWTKPVKEGCLEEVVLDQILERWIGLGEVKMEREAY